MKTQKMIATVIATTMVAGSVGVVSAQTTDVEVIKGENRTETAVKISKEGWKSAETVVLVNDSAIADALTATPLAFAKNAPILLTSKNKLSSDTKEEIKRLGAKNIILIGGNAVLPKAIENELEKLGLKIYRVEGKTREETALEIAKRLDKIKDVSEIAVVNGTKGLADAVSVAAAAAERNMPILLANPTKGLAMSEKFIKDEDINKSFVIGGKVVLSDELVSKSPGIYRIEGSDRNDTNAKVIEEFYKGKELKNIYLAKDGRGGDSQLIDALAVGVLAAKNQSPVLIASGKLNSKQVDVVNTKEVDKITQVGGNGNEGAFEQLENIEKETVYEVETVEEFKEALEKADANDKIVLKPNTTITEDIIVSTDKNVDIVIDGKVNGKVDVTAPNGSVSNNSTSTGGGSIGGGSIVVDGPEVARVSNEKELKDAMNNKEKTNIILNNDIEIKDTLKIEKNMTIDLNGYTIISKTTSEKNFVYTIIFESEGVELNLKNGIIDVTQNTKLNKYNVAIGLLTNNIKLNVNDVDINMGGYTYGDNKESNYENLYGISTNGTFNNIDINLNRCKINNALTGIYLPSDKTNTTLNNCEINSGTGISIKGGRLNVNDSTIIGVDDFSGKFTADDYINGLKENNSGSEPAGEAIYLEGNYDWDAIVNINGNSRLESKNGYVLRTHFIREKATSGEEIIKRINIKGGTLISETGKTIFKNHKQYEKFPNDKENSKKSIKITGGIFTEDVSDYCEEGFICFESDGRWVVTNKQ